MAPLQQALAAPKIKYLILSKFGPNEFFSLNKKKKKRNILCRASAVLDVGLEKDGKLELFKNFISRSVAIAKEARKSSSEIAKLNRKLKQERKALLNECSQKNIQRKTLVINGIIASVSNYAELNIDLQPFSNPSGLPVTFSIVEGAEHGTLTLQDNRLRYQPNCGFVGQEDIVIQASNGVVQSAETDLTIEVKTFSDNFQGDLNSLTPYRRCISSSEAQHLLDKVGFGGDQELLSLAESMTLDEFVQRLVDGPAGFDQAALQEAAYLLATPAKFDHTVERDLDGNGIDETRYRARDAFWGIEAFQDALLSMMIETKHPVAQTIAFFLHDHAATGFDAYAGDSARHDYIRKHMELLQNSYNLGFASFIQSLHHDPAMGEWLDNINNSRTSYNQNYAREVQELFTMGADSPAYYDGNGNLIPGTPNYTEADVQAMTEMLAGFRARYDQPVNYTYQLSIEPDQGYPGVPGAPQTIVVPINNGRVVFESDRWRRSSQGNITIYAGTPYQEVGYYNYIKANDILLYGRPGLPNRTARAISSKLFSYLAHVHLTSALIDELEASLLQADYNFKPLLKKIFASSAMFSQMARKDCVRSPVEMIVSLFRRLKLPFKKIEGVVDIPAEIRFQLSELAQRPGSPPSVFGWKGCGVNRDGKIENGEGWLYAQQVVNRQRASVGISNRLNTYFRQQNAANAWASQLLESGQNTPELIVAALAKKIGLELNSEQRDKLIYYLTHAVLVSGQDAVPIVWNTSRTGFLDQKLSGLLILMSNMAEFNMR